jgi:hypothetical protein
MPVGSVKKVFFRERKSMRVIDQKSVKKIHYTPDDACLVPYISRVFPYHKNGALPIPISGSGQK